MEAKGKGALRSALLHRPADICFVAVKRMRLGAVMASCRTADVFAFRLEACERFAGSLTNEISFDLRREPESKRQHFGLDVIAQTITVLDRPDRATAVHAETQNLHNHVQASAQPA